MRSSLRLFSLLVITAVVVLIVAAWQLGIPSTAAGMAAKNTCSAVFISRRPVERVIADDILPASVVLRLVRVEVDQQARTASAILPGSAQRHAVFRGRLGCVLLASGKVPDPDDNRSLGFDRPATPRIVADHATGVAADNGSGAERTTAAGPADSPTVNDAPLWPDGNRVMDPAQWPTTVDARRLQAVVAGAFSAQSSHSTSPIRELSSTSATRAVVVARNGRLLIEQYASGFDRDTPQLGWSMAKTVLSLLTWMRFSEQQTPLDTPVVDAMSRVPRPNWVGDWLRDGRAGITVEQLLTMRDGLDHAESYRPWSAVPRMLWREPDIASWASRAAIQAQPGTTWRYSSAVSNLLSRVLRDQFASDRSYWQYPVQALFDPIGMRSAVLETDADGTFIASSYLWASAQDWARLGQLILADGNWQGDQIVPPGWLAYALEGRTDTTGRRLPYGAQVWQSHDMASIDCPAATRLPPNGLLLLGHWGQVVGVFPSQAAVIVRLGWTADGEPWDRCSFLADILQALGPV